MTNNIENLMVPRYECIGIMPFLKFKVGDILNQHSCGVSDINYNWYSVRRWGQAVNACDIDKYPHLFRQLQWWEKRDVSEMPEYIKDKEVGEIVIKVDRHVGDMFVSEANAKSGWLSTLEFIPATLTEYEAYKNEQK